MYSVVDIALQINDVIFGRSMSNEKSSDQLETR